MSGAVAVIVAIVLGLAFLLLASATHLSTMDIQGALTFEPVPSGTRMLWSWEVRPRGLFKLVAPFIARVGERREQECWTGLKRFLEARPVPAQQA